MASDGRAVDDFADAIKKWKEFNFTALLKELDDMALKMVDNHENSLARRKQLAATIKQFRQQASSELIQQAGKIMKLFQEEVDSLTNRAKYAESEYNKVTNRLEHVNDPLPLIYQGQKLLEESSGMEDMKLELEVLKKKYQAVQKEKEEAAERSLQSHMPVSTHVKEIEAIEKRLNEKKALSLKEHIERENSLRDQLASTQKSLEETRISMAKLQNDFFSLELSKDQELILKQSDVDKLYSQLETLQQQIQTDMERHPVQSLLLAPESKEIIEEFENEILEKQSKITELSIELNRSKVRLEEHQRQSVAFIEEKQRMENELGRFQEELARRPTKEQISNLKHTIRLLKGGVERDEGVGTESWDDEDGQSEEDDGETTLDSVLFAKNKELNDKITELRVEFSRREEEFEKLNTTRTARIEELEAELADKTREEEQKSREESSILIVGTQEDTEDLVDIIKGQRDRFKGRMNQLEAEAQTLQRNVNETNLRNQQLVEDNLRLFEKMRYLQSYDTDQAPIFDDVEGKYKELYEEKTNPFSEFSRTESSKRFQRMGAADRVTFNAWRFFMGSKAARTGILIYLAFLHLFIFFLLQSWSSSVA